MTKLYMITEGDELDLPVAVADSVAELARMVGRPSSSLHSCFSKAKSPEKYRKYNGLLNKYHTVLIPEGDD